MKTYTGRYINPLKLKPSDIAIEDIAHHLSNICRFNGACTFHYSVAQHSCYVASICKLDPMAGLLHDASEAYLMDIPRPIKYTPEFEFYRKLEAEVQGMINECFGLPEQYPQTVKDADNAMLVAEGIQLMNELFTDFGDPAQCEIVEITPRQAKQYFLKAYQDILFGKAEQKVALQRRAVPSKGMH